MLNKVYPTWSYWLAVLFTLIVMVYGERHWKSTSAIDYYQYWVVGQAVKTANIDDVFSYKDQISIANDFKTRAQEIGSKHMTKAAENWAIIETANTPFLYSLIYLLSSGNFDKDYDHYRQLSIVLFFIGFLLLSAHLKSSPFTMVSMMTYVVFFFWPFKIEVALGNANLIQIGLIGVLVTLCTRRGCVYEFASGFLWGFLLMFKPNLIISFMLFSITYIFLQKRKKLSYGLGIFLSILIGLLTPLLLFGQKCWWESWPSSFTSISFSLDYYPRAFYFMSSFIGMLTGTSNQLVYLITSLSLSSVSAILVVFYMNKKDPGNLISNENSFFERHQMNIVIGIGIMIYLLSSPVVNVHHFLLLIPSYISLISIGMGTKKKPSWVPNFLIATSIVLLSSHPVLLHFELTHRKYHNILNYVGVCLGLVASFTFLTSKWTNIQSRLRDSATFPRSALISGSDSKVGD